MISDFIKKFRNFCLYTGVFFLIQSFVIKYSTLFNLSETIKSILMFSGIGLLVVSSVINNKRKVFINIMLMLFSLIIYKNCRQTAIIEFMSLILAVDKEEVDKVIKFTYKVLFIALLIHFITYIFVYLFDKNLVKIVVRNTTNSYRHSFYFSHANVFGLLCTWTYLMRLYLKRNDLKLFDYLFGFILTLFITFSVDSRTSAIVLFVTLFILIIFNKIPKSGKVFIKYSFIILALLSFVLMILYPSVPFIKVLDGENILHGRIKLGYISYLYNKPKLFGSNIDIFDSINLYTDFGLNGYTIDSTYYKMLFVYGYLFIVFYLGTFMMNMKKISNKDRTICFIFAMSLHAFMESFAIYPLVYFPIFLIISNKNIVSNIFNKKKER